MNIIRIILKITIKSYYIKKKKLHYLRSIEKFNIYCASPCFLLKIWWLILCMSFWQLICVSLVLYLDETFYQTFLVCDVEFIFLCIDSNILSFIPRLFPGYRNVYVFFIKKFSLRLWHGVLSCMNVKSLFGNESFNYGITIYLSIFLSWYWFSMPSTVYKHPVA